MFDPRDLSSDPRTLTPERPKRDPLKERQDRTRTGSRAEFDPRSEREDFTSRTERAVAEIGMYRTVAYKDLSEAHFDGHPYATRRAVDRMIQQGDVQEQTAKGPQGGTYKVLTLTGKGVHRAEVAAQDQGLDSGQKAWSGIVKSAELQHDTAVFRAAGFRQTVDASRALVDDLTPLRLLKAHEASEVLSELTNRPGTPWDGATGSGMNWRLAVSELEADRRNLRLDGEPVVLYSLLSPPGSARSNLLSDLYRLDATLTVTLEWRPQRLDSARRKIRGAQRHYFSKRYSMSAHVQETEGSAAAMVDTAAAAESDRLGDALVELETDGVAYGDLALTIAIHGPLEHTESLDGDIRRIFASHDAKVIREGYGQLPAWFSRMPGQPRRRQVRSVFVSAGVTACMAPIFGPPVGTPQSGHLRAAALAILETGWRTPYHYDLFQGDVGHTLVLGATGAGKSFSLNFLLVQALQYDPRILILDLGGSYRWLTQFLGGGYMELSPATADGEGFQLRPFSLPAGERTYQFLTGWISRLLRIGGWNLSGSDPSEIRARVEDLYAFEPPERTLGTLVHSLPSKMWPALGRWHGDGAWGKYFDNPADGEDLQFQDWQVIDMAGAAEHEDLCEAALFYLLERLRLALENPDETARVKLMVVDEAWRYLQDPAVLSYLAEAAKTWRKKNAALIVATQSAVDVTGTAGAEVLLESMPTKLFLANPDLPEKAAETFRLNPSEMNTIRGLIPKRELYLRRPDAAGILRLEVDPASYWLYTSSPVDAAKRAAEGKHGLGLNLANLGQAARGTVPFCDEELGALEALFPGLIEMNLAVSQFLIVDVGFARSFPGQLLDPGQVLSFPFVSLNLLENLAGGLWVFMEIGDQLVSNMFNHPETDGGPGGRDVGTA